MEIEDVRRKLRDTIFRNRSRPNVKELVRELPERIDLQDILSSEEHEKIEALDVKTILW